MAGKMSELGAEKLKLAIKFDELMRSENLQEIRDVIRFIESFDEPPQK